MPNVKPSLLIIYFLDVLYFFIQQDVSIHCLLTFRNDRFIAVCAFTERTAPKQAGFRWDPTARMWWTNDPAKAAHLIDYADEQATDALDDWRHGLDDWPVAG